MMNGSKIWFRIDAPAGWTDVFVRTVKATAVAFVVLELRGLFVDGYFDTPDVAVDAAFIAAGTFLLNAIHPRAKS